MTSADDQPPVLAAQSDHRISSLLMVLASTHQQERITLEQLMDGMGGRSFGMLLLLFTLPNLIPLGIPGLSTLTGLPLIIVVWQMLLGHEHPHLPDWLGRRSLRTRDFKRLCSKLCPWIARVERLTRPRRPHADTLLAQRCVALLALVQTIILILPIPFGNLLPAWVIAMLALGLMERDGVLLVAATLLSCVSVALVYGVVLAMVKACWLLIGKWWAGH